MDTITTTKTDKAIVIDSRLLASPLNNSLHNLLLKNHDVIYIDFDDNISMANLVKKHSNSIYKIFQLSYKYISFVGYKESCEFACELYNKSGITFNSYILIDSSVDLDDFSKMLKKEKNVSILRIIKGKATKYWSLDKSYAVQQYKTIMPLSYSQRVAKEVLGWLTYKVYKSTHLTDPFGDLAKLL